MSEYGHDDRYRLGEEAETPWLAGQTTLEGELDVDLDADGNGGLAVIGLNGRLVPVEVSNWLVARFGDSWRVKAQKALEQDNEPDPDEGR